MHKVISRKYIAISTLVRNYNIIIYKKFWIQEQILYFSMSIISLVQINMEKQQ